MTRSVLLLIIISLVLNRFIMAQNDTLTLAEVEVTSARNPVLFKEISRSIQVIGKKEIEQAPINSIDGILKYFGGMDIRSRGPMGVQSDISLRGGSFDQSLVLLNGSPVNDPQTGHHNLSLPMMVQNIEKIEILEGSGSRWFGPNAYSGGINIISTPAKTNDLSISLKGGQYQYLALALGGNYQIGSFSNNTSAGWTQSNGYISNTDFKILQLNHQSSIDYKGNMAMLHLGHLSKSFGANGFYTPKYPDQFEEIGSTFAGLKYERGKSLKLKTNIYWRRLNDRFELFREDKNWYVKQGDVYVNGADTAGFPLASGLYPYKGHNYHRTDVFGAEISLSFNSILGKTSAGIAGRSEKIWSNVLGMPMGDTLSVPGESDGIFTHSATRQNYTSYLEHTYTIGEFSISAGFSMFQNTDYGFHISPGIDVGYFLNKNLKWFATANKAIRLPTFTDLYYQGPSHISNAGLKPEEAISLESGLKYFRGSFNLSTSLFYRMGNNTIDWVKPDTESKWESQNITQLNTFGMSVSAFYCNSNNAAFPIQHIGMHYTYLDTDKSANAYISLYALDYLRHDLSIFVQGRIVNKLSASVTFAFQQRNGNYFDSEKSVEVAYDFVHLINAKLSYELKSINFFVEASNLLNQSYYDIGNIQQPGIWLLGGIKVNLHFPNK